MIDFFKKRMAAALVVAMLLSVSGNYDIAKAVSVGDVVINEIAWMGTEDSGSDEWIELYNNTASEIDLSGWIIEDDGNPAYMIESGSINAYSYFLIEDSEDAVSGVLADNLIALSLANSGDSLILKDNLGVTVDEVNAGGGAWAAGDSTSKASMERIDPQVSGDITENWADANSGNGETGSAGAAILGTPGSVNSSYDGAGAQVSFSNENFRVDAGEILSVAIEIDGAADLFSYGFDLIYDPTVLKYVSSEEGSFLSSDGANTAFNAALENGAEGKLIVGNTRLINPGSGIEGSGELFNVNFEVVGAAGSTSDILIGGKSFITDTNGDLPMRTGATEVFVSDGIVEPVDGLVIVPGQERYSLELSWNEAPGGADTYLVKREQPDGSFLNIAEVSELSFVDNLQVIPNVELKYEVFAIVNGEESESVKGVGLDVRGLSGDNNRSDRVDGHDLDGLARSFGEQFGSVGYVMQKDMNFDGVIDGNDLIDIGANFALIY